jgi:ABC-2 type transport system ATP-binding protein
MIQARGVSKRYGSTVAVDGLSFDARPGVVTGFLGPNGAGKSTTMRLLLGLDAPDAGEALIGGRRYRELGWPLREVGAVLEARAFHPGRSARAHLAALAASNDLPRSRAEEVLGIVGLADVAGRRAGQLSLGMAQRLGIAAALLGDPGVLLLDEPVNGLDPEGIRWMRDLLGSLAAQGRVVLFLQPPDRRGGAHRRAAGGDRPGPAAGADVGRRAVGRLGLAGGGVPGADRGRRRLPGEDGMTTTASSRAPHGHYRFAQVARMEWVKVRSLRSTWWALGATVAGAIAVAVAVNTEDAAADLTNNALAGIALGLLLTGVLGVLAMTGEYSSGTIRSTLAASPNRPLVLAAKAVVFGAVALAVGEAAAFIAFFAGGAALP